MQRAGHRQSGGGTAFASPSTSAYGASTSSFGTPEVSRFVPFKGTYTQKYAHRLTFYDRAPKDEITLDDFELWSLDRLRVLATIESAQARNRSYEDIKKLTLDKAKDLMPLSLSSAPHPRIDDERRKDYSSHFVLRLAFSRSEELRSRFLKAETLLFRFRFESPDVTVQERSAFLATLDLDLNPLDPRERLRMLDDLKAATFIPKSANSSVEQEPFFKVHWTKVADLVMKRHVLVRGGYAYVPQCLQLSLVCAEFTARLSRALEFTAKALPRLDEDDRLIPVLNHLSMAWMAGLTSEYKYSNEDGAEITADMVDELAKRHFPPCMSSMHRALSSSHKLKYEGRNQYNLFLKGIGMPVEEALVFWKRKFSEISQETFNKEYKYNFRHGYGLEGSRVNYAPRSCLQIIQGKVPSGQETHGCPFRHHARENLHAALASEFGVRQSADQGEILALVDRKLYHVACTRVFEIQHAAVGVRKGDGVGNGDSVDHPNLYFQKSREVYKKASSDDGSKPKIKGEDAMDVDQ